MKDWKDNEPVYIFINNIISSAVTLPGNTSNVRPVEPLSWYESIIRIRGGAVNEVEMAVQLQPFCEYWDLDVQVFYGF